MDVKFDGNRAVFSGDPIGYTLNIVDGAKTEDMTVNGATVKRLVCDQQRGTLTAEQMNEIGWIKGGTINTINTVSPSQARANLTAAQAGSDGWTVVDVPKTHVDQVENIKKAFFSNFSFYPEIGEDVLAMDQEMSRLADLYYDGEISEDELASAFQRLADGFITTCREKQYPFPMLVSAGMDEAALSTAYDHFRGALLKSAVAHNKAEGQELAGSAKYGWNYYNADWYYASEKAIASITSKVKDMASDKGFEEFGVPDYLALGKLSIYNFNSRVSGESDYIPGGLRAVESKWILDFDMVPPEDFKYFYMEGGGSDEVRMIEGDEFVPQGKKASAWAMYKDLMASVSFNYSLGGNAPSDLKNLGDLLQFASSSKEEIASVNSFLKKFQAAPQNYFSIHSVHAPSSTLNIKA